MYKQCREHSDIAKVTTKQEKRVSVNEIDRWEQRLSLYIRQMHSTEIPI